MHNARTIITLAVLLVFVAACGRQAGPITPSEQADKQDLSQASEYEVFSRKDASHKATTKPISGYTKKELDALPMAKQIVYKVVLPESFQAKQAQATIEKFIMDMSEKDKDIDEIEVHMYSEKSRLNGKYDIAMAVWAPGGKLGKVEPDVATGNKRDDYETRSHIKKNLAEYLERRGKFKSTDMDNLDEDGLTEEDKKDIEHILEDLEKAPATNSVAPLR